MSDPFGVIIKVNPTAGTVTTVQDHYCETGFKCAQGLALLNGSLISAAIGGANGLTLHFYSTDPVTGNTILLSSGLLPDTGGAYQDGPIWLDTVGSQLFMGTESNYAWSINSHGMFWGTADPNTGVFTKLSDDRQFPSGDFARGLALVQPANATPEPTTISLIGLGLLGLVALKRSK